VASAFVKVGGDISCNKKVIIVTPLFYN